MDSELDPQRPFTAAALDSIREVYGEYREQLDTIRSAHDIPPLAQFLAVYGVIGRSSPAIRQFHENAVAERQRMLTEADLTFEAFVRHLESLAADNIPYGLTAVLSQLGQNAALLQTLGHSALTLVQRLKISVAAGAVHAPPAWNAASVAALAGGDDARLKRIQAAVELGTAVRVAPVFSIHLAAMRRAGSPPITLSLVAAGLQALRFNPAVIGEAFLAPYGLDAWSCLTWDGCGMTEYFAGHAQLLVDALKPRRDHDYELTGRRRTVFRILGLYDYLLPELKDFVWETAFGSNRREAALARRVARCSDELLMRVRDALDGKDAKRRIAAVEWAAELGERSFIERIVRLLRAEKNDDVQSRIGNALERLGVPLSEFVDRGALKERAESERAKGTPALLTPLGLVAPALRWADTGERIDEPVVQWLIAWALQLRNPEPSAMLRNYLLLMHEDDRQVLAERCFEAWLKLDLRDIPSWDEAKEKARSWAEGPYHVPPYTTYPVERRMMIRAREIRGEVKTGANDQKGILAIVAAGGTDDIAHEMYRYVTDWYGYRVHQCRALVRSLAYFPGSVAIQIVQKLAAGFRTASIQKEAELALLGLAARSGWTLAELEDRTVPTADLDDRRQRRAECAGHTFTIRFDRSAGLVVFDADGSAVDGLPEPSDTASEADDEAREALVSGRKTVKTVLKVQTERLRRACSVQRSWPKRQWEELLLQHPLVGDLCTRLVWRAALTSGESWSFLPTEDGGFVDHRGEPVSLPDACTVTLFHPQLDEAGVTKGWKARLKKLKIKQPFAQLDRERRRLDAHLLTSMFSNLQNIEIDAVTLKQAAQALGFLRAPTGDGGYYGGYVKRFPEIAVEVHLETEGIRLPEENVPVEMCAVRFLRLEEDEKRSLVSTHDAVPFEDLPPPLLADILGDVEAIQRKGSPREQPQI